jgi:hypothetical protein
MKQESRPVAKSPKTPSLVVERLEMVSKTLFKQYFDLITDLVGSCHGIYALYDGTDLYYVGKSTDLRKRVRAHLRDRHLANWTHFSLYLVRSANHLDDMESLLVRIANPKGNRVAPRGNGNAMLRRELSTRIKQRQKQELAELLGGKFSPQRHGGRRKNPGIKAAERKRSIAGIVSKRTLLFRSFKGKDFKAYLYPTGTITLGGTKYSSPSAAAKAAAKRTAINGWQFWYIKDENGNWVRLSDFHV